VDRSAELRKLLKRPLQTEKVVHQTEALNTYTFEVPTNANKIEIKRAVEEIFEVKVKDVHTIRIQGKLKRFGRYLGRRPNWKKALVTLQPGQKLELYENV